MKKIPNKTFTTLLRLADNLCEAPSYATAQTLRGILYAIWRDQYELPRSGRGLVSIKDISTGEAIVPDITEGLELE